MRTQFSLKSLFACVTLISAGVGILAYLFVPKPGHSHAPLHSWQLALWILSGAIIGAGVLAPIKRPIAGASIGLIVQIIAWISMGVIWS